MIKEFYQNLRDYIVGFSFLNHVEYYKKQPDNEEAELAYSLPACFIEFVNMKSNEENSSVYKNTFLVKFHLELSGLEMTSLEELEMIDLFRQNIKNYLYIGQRFEPLDIDFDNDEISHNPVNILSYEFCIFERRKC